MFPVSEKPNPKGSAMKPVVFNHLIHEKKVENCETCHHTGDPVACTTCHTVEGKAEGNFITLDRAMHATNIAKRAKGNTPVSCVSCHEQQTKERRGLPQNRDPQPQPGLVRHLPQRDAFHDARRPAARHCRQAAARTQ